MDEQNNINQITKPEDGSKKNISTILGTVIIIILTATIAFFAWKFISRNNADQPSETLQTQDQATQSFSESAESDSAVSELIVEEKPAVGTKDSINFEYEIEQLDNQLSPAKDTDFNEAEFSDSALGV